MHTALRWLPLDVSMTTLSLLPACGGGGDTPALAADGKSSAYGAGAVTMPTADELKAYAGPFGRILDIMAGKGHFDAASKALVDLDQVWGVSPIDGTTMFAKGVK